MRLALDIGGTTITAARVDGASVLERRSLPTPAAAGPEAVVDAAARLLTPWVLHPGQISVAATGQVRGGRVSAVNPGTMPGWHDYPLETELAARTGCSVRLLNDAHAAAWGEFRFGAGRGSRNFVFITVSTGIGAGLIVNGDLVTGATGLAGHVGFWRDLSGASNEDYLELHASGRAIAERGSRQSGRTMTTSEVFTAAAGADASAAGIVADAVDRLARALLNLRWLLDPELIAIGGSVGLAEGYLTRLEARLTELAPDVQLQLVPARLQHDAGLLGAADRCSVESELRSR